VPEFVVHNRSDAATTVVIPAPLFPPKTPGRRPYLEATLSVTESPVQIGFVIPGLEVRGGGGRSVSWKPDP
jgi:hypothetical protein